MNQAYHVPVMLNASLEALNLGGGGVSDEHRLATLGLLVRHAEEVDEALTFDEGVLRATPTHVGAPQEWTQHDWELEPLRLEDREHLDGVIVTIDATFEEFGAEFVVGIPRPPLKEVEEPPRAAPGAGRLPLEELADVLEIGELTLSTDGGEDALTEAGGAELGQESGHSPTLERVSTRRRLVEERELIGVGEVGEVTHGE